MLKTSSVTRVGLFIGGAIVGVFLSDLIHAPTLRLCNEADFQNGLAERPGLEVLIFTSDWQPGFRLPLHIHPDGHEFVYVMEGERLWRARESESFQSAYIG
jgi:hypothetical protein